MHAPLRQYTDTESNPLKLLPLAEGEEETVFVGERELINTVTYMKLMKKVLSTFPQQSPKSDVLDQASRMLGDKDEWYKQD